MRTLVSLTIPFWALCMVNPLPAQDALPPQRAAGGQPAAAAPTTDRATLHAQASYVIGRNIGTDFRRNDIKIDPQNFLAGVTDALNDAELKWSEAECQVAMEWFQREMQRNAEVRAKQMQQAGAANQQQATKFLAENRTKQGVQTTASGLQYRVLKQGNGAAPTMADTVTCHYKGTLLDGTVFDSSYDRGEPAQFPVDGVIRGWTEALQLMKVGDKWQLFVPAELAYGNDPPGPPIQPGSLLVFEVELLKVN